MAHCAPPPTVARHVPLLGSEASYMKEASKICIIYSMFIDFLNVQFVLVTWPNGPLCPPPPQDVFGTFPKYKSLENHVA